ncbi:MAG TPA: DUF3048 domain-containing protein [Actinomycetota bacterium]|nr:DUF3048 domain-containing protein [Actinomycetota bacterium]
MRTRLLCLLLLVALVAAACGGDSEPQAARRSATPSESPSPPPEPVRCPLTGVEAGAVDINRPAMAVKIDNHPRARPQAGLETADIVYEELVEGGLTRFMGIYHCGDAGDLGPVRSARAVDPDIMVQYAPVLFAYSGASPNNLNKVAATAGIVNLMHGSNGPAYSRRGGRSAPHNLFTSTEKIRARPAAQGVQGPPRTGIVFNPDLGAEASPSPSPSPTGGATASPGAPAPPAPPPVAVPGNRISFAYSAAASVSYTYDPASRRYLRNQGGGPHNAASGTQLGGTNVVVMKVPVSRGGSSPEIAVTGSGEAVVLRNGEAIVGQWHRGTLGDQTTFVDAAGQPIEFAVGNTWINLLPNDQGWTLE